MIVLEGGGIGAIAVMGGACVDELGAGRLEFILAAWGAAGLIKFAWGANIGGGGVF